jgi:hypothetical protein
VKGAVSQCPSSVDREEEAAAAVVVGIEVQDERVGVEPGVAPAEARNDLPRLGVVHTRGDVERLVIVGEPHLGALGRRCALRRIALREARDGGLATPHGLRERAVEGDGLGQAHGPHLGLALDRNLDVLARRGRGDEQRK